MEGQRVPGSLQSIAHWRAKYNGNGLKITILVFLWPLTQL
jgi:hypothetical protein